MAKEQREYFRRDFGELHDASNGFRRQWRDLPRDGHQLRDQHYEQLRDLDGQPGFGRAEHHDAAGEPNGDRGTDRDIFRRGGGNRASHLSVAEKQREHFRRDFGKLHDAGDGFRRQRRDLPRDRHQPRHQHYEQSGNAYRQPGRHFRRNRRHDLSQRHCPHRPEHHGNDLDAGQREFDNLRPAAQPRRGRPGGRGAAVSVATLHGGRRAQRRVHRDRARLGLRFRFRHRRAALESFAARIGRNDAATIAAAAKSRRKSASPRRR